MPIFDLRNDIPKIRKELGKPFDGITSGIECLDNKIIGFDKGEMITIAGRPGMGKSSLARDILLNVSKPENNYGVGVLCTMEMPCSQVIELLATNLAKIDFSNMKKGDANERTIDKFNIAIDKLSEYNIIINDDSYLIPESIRKLLLEISKVEPISCLIIDYLQLMSLRTTMNNRQEEVAQISRELKAINMEFNVPVIAFSQLNRNVEYRESCRPRMVDLRESGAMENDSSMIILIHRQSYYDKQLDPNAEDTGEAEFIICKHRTGNTGTVECAFIGEWMSFCDRPKEF